jgi:hypothetical protein
MKTMPKWIKVRKACYVIIAAAMTAACAAFIVGGDKLWTLLAALGTITCLNCWELDDIKEKIGVVV